MILPLYIISTQSKIYILQTKKTTDSSKNKAKGQAGASPVTAPPAAGSKVTASIPHRPAHPANASPHHAVNQPSHSVPQSDLLLDLGQGQDVSASSTATSRSNELDELARSVDTTLCSVLHMQYFYDHH